RHHRESPADRDDEVGPRRLEPVGALPIHVVERCAHERLAAHPARAHRDAPLLHRPAERARHHANQRVVAGLFAGQAPDPGRCCRSGGASRDRVRATGPHEATEAQARGPLNGRVRPGRGVGTFVRMARHPYLPRALRDRIAGLPRLQRALWAVEGALVAALWGLLRCFDPDRAVRAMRAVMSRIGPRLAKSRNIRDNLAIMFPEQTPEQRAAIEREIWGYWGAHFADYAHLGRIIAEPPRIKIGERGP